MKNASRKLYFNPDDFIEFLRTWNEGTLYFEKDEVEWWYLVRRDNNVTCKIARVRKSEISSPGFFGGLAGVVAPGEWIFEGEHDT